MSEIERPGDEENPTPTDKEGERGKKKLGIFYEERLPELEPKEFHEGFTVRTILGALFVAVIMMPGSIYLSLMMGQQMGPAAEWTTIILFVEVARRSFTVLRRQEIYLIYYLAGALVVSAGGLMAGAGGPFFWLIWNQYLRRSTVAKNFGIAEAADPRMMIPTWVAPPLDSTAYIQRTFLHNDWVLPILIIVATNVIMRMQWLGLGYALFRTTSDVEKLPFPLAPVAAQGATALAEVSQERETWRWNVFSAGTMVGLLYGFLYVAVPILTGAFQPSPQFLIPIPFLDFTLNAESAFPTGRIGISTDLGLVLFGFVLPFPIVVGGFIGSVFSNFIFSPSLYRWGIAHGENFFPTWKHGMNLIQSEISTGFDLWISVGIGIAFAIAIIGMGKVAKSVAAHRRASADKEKRSLAATALPVGRGDFPIALAMGAWGIASIAMVLLIHKLVPGFPFLIICLFAFLWSPLVSYVSARLLGMTGQPIAIPYMTEAAFILSGYKGADIWFAPRATDFGWAAQRFREIELTGTKFTSVVKAEVFALVLVMIFSFLYWSFYWKLSDIPSAQYPYAQTFWPLNAFYQCLWPTGTLPGGANYLMQAIKFKIIGSTLVGAVGVYGLMSLVGIHTMWFYGLLAGSALNVTNYIPMFIGALFGRYYMTRRFGIRKWQLYAPVLFAGYACGVGLTGMFSIAIAIIFKAVRVLPY